MTLHTCNLRREGIPAHTQAMGWTLWLADLPFRNDDFGLAEPRSSGRKPVLPGTGEHGAPGKISLGAFASVQAGFRELHEAHPQPFCLVPVNQETALPQTPPHAQKHIQRKEPPIRTVDTPHAARSCGRRRPWLRRGESRKLGQRNAWLRSKVTP